MVRLGVPRRTARSKAGGLGRVVRVVVMSLLWLSLWLTMAVEPAIMWRHSAPKVKIIEQGVHPHPGPGYDPFGEFADQVEEEADLEWRQPEVVASQLAAAEVTIRDAVDRIQAPLYQNPNGISSELQEFIAAKREEAVARRLARVQARMLDEVPAFAAAKKFAGARLGAVFKRGQHGMGYYKDVGLVQVLQLETLLRPLAWMYAFDLAVGAAHPRPCYTRQW